MVAKGPNRQVYGDSRGHIYNSVVGGEEGGICTLMNFLVLHPEVKYRFFRERILYYLCQKGLPERPFGPYDDATCVTVGLFSLRRTPRNFRSCTLPVRHLSPSETVMIFPGCVTIYVRLFTGVHVLPVNMIETKHFPLETNRICFPKKHNNKKQNILRTLDVEIRFTVHYWNRYTTTILEEPFLNYLNRKHVP